MTKMKNLNRGRVVASVFLRRSAILHPPILESFRITSFQKLSPLREITVKTSFLN